jgi:hypothetical protein
LSHHDGQLAISRFQPILHSFTLIHRKFDCRMAGITQGNQVAITVAIENRPIITLVVNDFCRVAANSTAPSIPTPDSFSDDFPQRACQVFGIIVFSLRRHNTARSLETSDHLSHDLRRVAPKGNIAEWAQQIRPNRAAIELAKTANAIKASEPLHPRFAPVF